MGHGRIDKCQICETAELRLVLFLGYLPPVNTMRRINTRPEEEPRYPAELLACPTCHLVQLGFTVDPRILFPPDYPYTSGTTRLLRANFADLYREIRERIGLTADDLIVDIGSNDGTLLSNFKDGGCRIVGIEPTLTGTLANARGIPTVQAFFDERCAAQVKTQYGSPRIITAANVFAHIPEIHGVMKSIEALLNPEGVFISESHYLRDLIDTLQYDVIYHEHLRYYSVTSLGYLLKSHGFRVFHIKRIPSHGGSIRVYASKSAAYAVDASVNRILREEAEAGLTGEEWIGRFRDGVVRSKIELYELVSKLKRGQAAIYGIGAPSRASTLINYTGLDDGILDCVLEIKGSQKIGRYVPGTNIPVFEEPKLYADQPPYVLLLSWHIADELSHNLKRRGYLGDFIVPLPAPRIIRNADVAI